MAGLACIDIHAAPGALIEPIFHAFATPSVVLTGPSRLRDRQAKVAVIRRVNRIEQGNFGDHKFCRDGVWELRVDIGPGYRVYYAQAGRRIVLLLCCGNKRTQTVDIHRAVDYWQDWQRRNDDEKQST